MGNFRRLCIALPIVCAVPIAGAALTHAETAGAPAAKEKPSACKRGEFRLALDVGHTAKQPGATSARGAKEYDFNLRLAKVIERKLIDAGFTKTALLITDGTMYKALAARVAKANRMPADLFLSIHHDSVPDQFLEKWEYEGEERVYSDRFKGHSLFISDDNPERANSLQFAKFLGKELKDRGLQYTPHYVEKFMGSRQRILVDADTGVYRYDQLIVLRTTRMPAVLLEAGSIINRDEELEVATPERQALIANATVAAVDAYCAAHSPRAGATASASKKPANPKR
jgi:N-acetylmuramoyl-L-alanine amidase